MGRKPREKDFANFQTAFIAALQLKITGRNETNYRTLINANAGH